MEDKDMKYNEILDVLRTTEPVLYDANVLTDRIMQRVEQTVACAGRIRVMRIAGMLSGVAASALICLFAYETLKYPVFPADNYTRSEQSYDLTVLRSYDLTVLRSYNLTVLDKETALKRRETQRKRKEQMSEFLAVRNGIINHLNN